MLVPPPSPADRLLGDPQIALAVQSLSVQQRAVIYHAYWDDLAPASIAELLDVSVGSVVTVEPVNRTDRFEGLRFRVVVADVDLAEDQPFYSPTPGEEVRAFDAAGELLDTQRPGGR